MEKYEIWKILGIAETKDTDAIRQVYHEKLRSVNPEDDQVGFMRLREAYENALSYAGQKDEAENADLQDAFEALKDGSETDRFIYQMNRLYVDVDSRKDEAQWQSLMDSYEDDLDGELQERVLVYIMDHHFFPWKIWKILDDKFHICAETELLKEKFPENFLGYVNYYIQHDSFIDYDIFEGDVSDHVDEYINRYLDLKNQIDRMEEAMDPAASAETDGTDTAAGISEIRHEFELLDAYEIHHPYADAEKLHFWLICSKDEKLPDAAMEIADRLASDYPDDCYTGYYAGLVFLELQKTEVAEQIFEGLLKQDEASYLANLGMLKTRQKQGKYADAKELCLDILDMGDRSFKLNNLLDSLNESLVPQYREMLNDNPEDTETRIEIGWCYFQQQKFDQVEKTLKAAPEDQFKKYDFVNLMGRNYLAMEKYDLALPYLICWRDMIDQTVDDHTKDSKKKLNRKGFSHFAVGMCHWNLGQKEIGIQEIKDGVALETAVMYQMSYNDQLAQYYIEDEEYQKAYDLCSELIQKDETYYPAYLHRQEAAFHMHKGQSVIDDFYQCKRIFPGYVKPYEYAMKVFYYAGQYTDALNIYEQAQEEKQESDVLQLYYYKCRRNHSSDNEELRPLICEFYRFKKQYIEKYDKKKKEAGSLNHNPEKPESGENEIDETPLELSELFLEDALYRLALDDSRTALATIREGLGRCPDDIGLLELMGDVLWDNNKKDEALVCYQRLVALNLHSYNVFLKLGKYFYGKEDDQGKALDQAMDYFRMAYEVNPKGQENLYYLSRSFRYKVARLKEEREKDDAYQCALLYAKEMYELEKDAFNTIELGLVYEFGRDYEKALHYYIKATELEPDNVYAHNNAGNIFIRTNRLDEAERELKISEKLEDDEEPTRVYIYLSELYEKKKDYALCAQYIKKQLDRYPKDYDLWMRLIGCYEKEKNYMDAAGAYQKLLELGFIKKYELCYHNAKYYYMDGKKLQAMKLYHEALALTKNDPKAKDEVVRSKKEWK